MRRHLTIFLLFAFLWLPHFLFSQQDSVPKAIKPVRGIYEAGSFINGNFSRLNTDLAQSGFPALQPPYGGVSLGISARPIDKGSYFTASLFVLTTSSQYPDTSISKTTNFRLIGFQEEQHLDLVKSDKWRIGPDLGLGFGIQRLRLYERLYAPPNFAAALSPSVVTHQEKLFKSASFFINAGMGVDRKFKFKYTDFYFGVGAGYRLSTPAIFSIKYQDVTSPKSRLSGVQYDFKFRFEIREFKVSEKKGQRYRKFH